MSTDLFLNALGNDVFEISLERPERMNALGVATVAALRRPYPRLLRSGPGLCWCVAAAARFAPAPT